MASDSWILHVLSRRGAKRRFPPAQLRPRDNNPLAPGQIPSSLTNPIGSTFGPGRTIWEFVTPPTKLNFGDGAIVTTARLVPLFWGDFWRTATNPSVGDIHQAVADILNSPYLSEVMQYGFQSLSLDPAMIVISPGPPFPAFSDDDPANMVWDLIDGDKFPEPDDDGGRIVYMVFAPHGTNYSIAGAVGAHTGAIDPDRFELFDGDHAWVGWCNYGTLDNITETFTHELVEILTDPEPYDGYTVQGLPELNNEIVDSCFNQVGMVSGYRVSAYYSDRLKACVVPSYPHRFALSVSTKEERFGPSHPQLLGRTEATKHSFCFEGTYEWTTIAQQRRVTFTASAVGYIAPEYVWEVNGTPVFSSSSLGLATQPITTPAATFLDPLSMITTLPPHTVTAKVAAGLNVLVLESQFGEAPGSFDVVCTVTEDLPSGYHTARTNQQSTIIAGIVRFMDERFQQDLARCMHLKSVLARKLIEEVVIPRIDKGDPPNVWVERAVRQIETELSEEAQQARYLAHLVEDVEPALAATLRGLAEGMTAQAFATRTHSPTETGGNT